MAIRTFCILLLAILLLEAPESGWAQEVEEHMYYFLTEVEVISDPPGADVYFVPADEFDEARLCDERYVRGYRIPEGQSNTTTLQRERNYTVVFERGGQRRIRYNVRPIYGRPYTVRVEFNVELPVEVWSDPPGAAVYFIPTSDFVEARLSDPQYMMRYRISEGNTNTATTQREGSYMVVFELNGRRAIRHNQRVIRGAVNRVGAVFSIPYVSVEVWSYPSRATVYFVPEDLFDLSLLNGGDALRRFRIREGVTNTTTSQREGTYAVILELEGSLGVIEGYEVAADKANRLGIRFEEAP